MCVCLVFSFVKTPPPPPLNSTHHITSHHITIIILSQQFAINDRPICNSMTDLLDRSSTVASVDLSAAMADLQTSLRRVDACNKVLRHTLANVRSLGGNAQWAKKCRQWQQQQQQQQDGKGGEKNKRKKRRMPPPLLLDDTISSNSSGSLVVPTASAKKSARSDYTAATGTSTAEQDLSLVSDDDEDESAFNDDDDDDDEEYGYSEMDYVDNDDDDDDDGVYMDNDTAQEGGALNMSRAESQWNLQLDITSAVAVSVADAVAADKEQIERLAEEMQTPRIVDPVLTTVSASGGRGGNAARGDLVSSSGDVTPDSSSSSSVSSFGIRGRLEHNGSMFDLNMAADSKMNRPGQQQRPIHTSNMQRQQRRHSLAAPLTPTRIAAAGAGMRSVRGGRGGSISGSGGASPIRISSPTIEIGHSNIPIEKEDLDNAFLALLEDTGVRKDQCEMHMSTFSDLQKYHMIINYNKSKVRSRPYFADIDRFLRQDVASTSVGQLRQLKVILQTRNSNLVDYFLDRGGLDRMADIIGRTNYLGRRKSEYDLTLQYEVCCIIKSVCGTDKGITSFIDRQNVVSTVVLLLDSESLRTRVIILELFAVCCVFSRSGYHVILSAFDHYKFIRRESTRFANLVQSIDKWSTDQDYLEAALVLVNSLLNSPMEVSTRLKIQKQFIDLGLPAILESIVTGRQNLSEHLKIQIDVFQEELNCMY